MRTSDPCAEHLLCKLYLKPQALLNSRLRAYDSLLTPRKTMVLNPHIPSEGICPVFFLVRLCIIVVMVCWYVGTRVPPHACLCWLLEHRAVWLDESE